MTSKTEINAVVKILDDPRWETEGATSQDVASAIIDKLDELRSKSAKFSTFGRIALPGGDWHYFSLAPFSTLLQAQRAGENFTHDPKSRTGEGFYRAVPIVKDARAAWESIRPDQVNDKEWIREQIQTGMTGLSDPNVYKDRGKW